MEMQDQKQKPTQIAICSWCKDQVKDTDKRKHAETCALIPADERNRILSEKDGVFEELKVD